MGKSNFRRVSAVVTAQTAGNLEKLRKMAGYGNVGMVIDKLVRDKMVQLRMWDVRQSVCGKGSLPPSPQGGDTSLVRGRHEGSGGKGGRHG